MITHLQRDDRRSPRVRPRVEPRRLELHGDPVGAVARGADGGRGVGVGVDDVAVAALAALVLVRGPDLE